MDWLQEHGNDLIPVKMIDLISTCARIMQANRDGRIIHDGCAASRLVDCDLPRLLAYLPTQALIEMSEAFL